MLQNTYIRLRAACADISRNFDLERTCRHLSETIVPKKNVSPSFCFFSVGSLKASTVRVQSSPLRLRGKTSATHAKGYWIASGLALLSHCVFFSFFCCSRLKRSVCGVRCDNKRENGGNLFSEAAASQLAWQESWKEARKASGWGGGS